MPAIYCSGCALVIARRGETTHSGVEVNNTHPPMIKPLNNMFGNPTQIVIIYSFSDEWEIFHDYSLPVADTSCATLFDSQECISQCTSALSCRAFDFTESTGQCCLKQFAWGDSGFFNPLYIAYGTNHYSQHCPLSNPRHLIETFSCTAESTPHCPTPSKHGLNERICDGGVTEVLFVNFSVRKFSILQKYTLDYSNHIHIW